MSTVAEELGMLSASPEQVEAEQEVAVLRPEQSERAGAPLFFRKPEQRLITMRSAHATLQSQQVLTGAC
jgi:type I restriction enzyme R subunit